MATNLEPVDFSDIISEVEADIGELEARINGLTGLLEIVVEEARVDRRRLHYELSEFERKLAELKGETNGEDNDEGVCETVAPAESDAAGSESGIAETD